MSEQTKVIVFDWRGADYTIPEAKSPIVLPDGEILSVEKWGESNPEKPLGLRLMTKLPMSPGTDLAMVAMGMKGVLATPVLLEVYYACPKGCFNPTKPFCSECGSKVEVVSAYVPITSSKKQTPHVIDGVVDVKGEGPCPNCGETLNHDDHAANCPTCGQALHWICR